MNAKSLANYTECPAPLLARKAETSSSFHVYRRAFQDATGLSIQLLPPEPEAEGDFHSNSPLCQALNERPRFSCARCSLSHFNLDRDGGDSFVFGECRAGLHYLIAPVRFAGLPVFHLEAGQFLLDDEAPKDPHQMEAAWREKVPSLAGRESAAHRLHAQSKSLSRAELERAAGLLNVFAELLGGSLNGALLQDAPEEPIPVRAAKAWLRGSPPKSITLEDVAAAQGWTAARFSLLFREVTGLSFAEFAERTRLEKARRFLLERTTAKFRGAAALAGCLSLTELNTLFNTCLGEKATVFRRRLNAARRRLAEYGKPEKFPLVPAS